MTGALPRLLTPAEAWRIAIGASVRAALASLAAALGVTAESA